jgi:hypothetical protein
MANIRRQAIDYLKISNYQDIQSLYNLNIENNPENWLEFNSVFTKLGENSIVGIFNQMDNQSKIVFKFSKYINHLVRHEDKIYKSIDIISYYCPHFSRSYGMIRSKLNKNFKAKNPFHLQENSYGIDTDILLMEYIENKPKFNSYLLNPNVSEKIIFSTIKQVLLSICLAQKKKQFTHYDLHSSNIFMERCEPNIVFLYVIDEHNQFYIAPKGHFPIIFDFGFSYTKDIDNNNMHCLFQHTETGHTSNVFDWIADAKNFLVSVSNTLSNRVDSKKIKKFRNVIKNIFFPLKIDWTCGWNKSKDISASQHIVDIFRKLTKVKSELFRTKTYECVDIIQSLIILPFDNQNYTDIKLNYYGFIQEWIKIESEFICKQYMLTVFKGIVESANTLRPFYIDIETRQGTIEFFRDAVYEEIGKVSKFCRPKNINFDLMLGSLLLLSNNIEGIYFTISKEIENNKTVYNDLIFSSVEQIYGAIEVLFQDDFTFKKKTKILIFDSIQEKTIEFRLSHSQINYINQISNLVKGTYIYDVYKSSIETPL